MKNIILLISIISFSASSYALDIRGNEIKLGAPDSTDKEIKFNGVIERGIRSNQASGKLEFTHDGSNWKPMGSGSGSGGGGGINALSNSGAEDQLNGWTASAGVFSLETIDPLNGAGSFNWIPIAQNDVLETAYISFDTDKFKGQACQGEITYIGGDENLTVQAIDQAGSVLGSKVLQAHSIKGTESFFFLCPNQAQITSDSNKGNVKFQLVNTGAAASPLIKFDDVYLGTLKGLVETNTPDTLGVTISSTGAVWRDTGDPVNGDCTKVSTGDFECFYNAGIFTEVPLVTCSGYLGVSSGYCEVIIATTSKFRVRLISHVGAQANNHAMVNIVKMGVDAKQTVQTYSIPPTITQNQNSFVTQINKDAGNCYIGAGADDEWFTISSLQSYKCGFDVSTLGNVNRMSCHCQAEGNTSNRCTISHTSDNTFEVTTTNTNGSGVISAFSLTCDRQTDDVKTPTVQPILVNQVSTSVQRGIVKESCYVLNLGTPQADSDQCDGWVNNITDLGVGLAQINHDEFSDDLNCTCSVTNTSSTRICQTLNVTPTSFRVQVKSLDAVPQDNSFTVSCSGAR